MDKIRDLRGNFFRVDDEYLNGYAKLCGINATGVYLSMCRHADKQQTCFPSKRLIAEELAISERSVYTAIKKLAEWNIIKIEQQGRKEDGSFKNLLYTLLIKDDWKDKPSANGAVGKKRHSPSANDDTTRRQQVPNKETHINHTHKNQTHIANSNEFAGNKINSLIEKFKPINPTYTIFFKNTTQRKALERLVKQFTYEKVSGMIDALPKIVCQKYAPQISTPLQLENKLGQLLIFMKQNQGQQGAIQV